MKITRHNLADLKRGGDEHVSTDGSPGSGAGGSRTGSIWEMHRAGCRIWLTVLTVLVSLIVFEIALRLVWPAPKPFKSKGNLPWLIPSRTLGWVNRPGYTGRQTKPGAFDVAIAINSLGVRGPDRGYARTPGKKRILVVGDSFSFGHGVEQHDTFCARLEAVLPDTEVINGAIVGIGHDQQLLWLKEEGLKYKPDLVLWAYTSADIPRNTVSFMRTYDPETGIDFGKPRFYLEGGRLELGNVPVAEPEEIPWLVIEHAEDRFKERPWYARFAMRHSAAARFIARGIDAIAERREQLKLARTIAHEFIKTARQSRVPILVIHLPVEKWLTHNTPLVALKRYLNGRIIREVTQAAKAPLLDLTPDFKNVPGGDIAGLFIPGDGHFSVRGHDLVAHTIEKYFAAHPISGTPE